MDDRCPNRVGCCSGCINELAEGHLFYDDFDEGCCEHRQNATTDGD